MTTIGIIGTGSFGAFLKHKLDEYFDVMLVGRKSSEADWTKAARADYIVLAVSFDGYAAVLERLQKLTPTSSIIVDVCSVKMLPIALIKKYLPKHTLLATHPLFGPQSAAETLQDHVLVICPQPGASELEKQAASFFGSLALEVKTMSAEEHDKLMADVHGLTFFVARALVLYGVELEPIMTPSYQKLLDLANLERNHSPELFATIQTANPYAAATREKFVAIADKLSDSLHFD